MNYMKQELLKKNWMKIKIQGISKSCQRKLNQWYIYLLMKLYKKCNDRNKQKIDEFYEMEKEQK